MSDPDYDALSPAVKRIVRMILCEGWCAEALDVMPSLAPDDIEEAVRQVDEHPKWDRSICV